LKIQDFLRGISVRWNKEEPGKIRLQLALTEGERGCMWAAGF
jgi:hypothetical protein